MELEKGPPLGAKKQAFEAFKERARRAHLEGLKEKVLSGGASVSNKDAEEWENVPIVLIPGLGPQLPEHKEAMGLIVQKRQEIERKIRDLKLENESLEQRLRLVEQIPVLFDYPDFSDIKRHLEGLEASGISKILVGKREYSISDILEILEAVEDYSLAEKQGLHNTLDRDKYLASLGVTGAKISPFSALGFRRCMFECIENDTRVVSRKAP